MADPLGVSASIIAVLQLASDVASYISDVKGAPAEWKRLRHEIRSLEDVLRDLQGDEGQDQEWKDKIRTFEAPDGPLARIYKALQFVNRKIEPQSGIRKTAKAFRWPFDAKDVEKVIAAVEREKSLLDLAFTSDCHRLTRKLHAKSEESQEQLVQLLKELQGSSSNIQETVDSHHTEVIAGIGELKSNEEDDKRSRMLNWLSSSNYPAQQFDLIERRESGTGRWLLESQEYRTWLTESSGTLFCPGIPGAGKTMLTAIVIDDLTFRFSSHDNIGVAYVFYGFRRTNEQDPTHVVSALLKQLVQQRSAIPAEANRLYEKHRKQNTSPLFAEALDALRSVINLFARVFILIDALDEADRSCYSRVSSVLLSDNARGHANFFATSRFIPGITKAFSVGTQLEIRASKHDVERYLEGQMPNLASYSDWSPELCEEIKSTISKAVDGMFLLATIYLNALDDKVTRRQVQHALTQFQGQVAATNDARRREVLNQAYHQAMERISDQKEGFRTLAMKALSWITFAKEPLTPLQLRHALAVEPGDAEFDKANLYRLRRIITVCAGLVTYDSATDDIRLVHYTAQEYLQTTLQQWYPSLHDDMTVSLITYLSFNKTHNALSRLYGSYFERSKPDLYPQSLFLYKHACLNWGYYAQKSIKVDQAIMDFLTSGNCMAAANPLLYHPLGPLERRHEGYDVDYPVVDLSRVTGLHLSAYFGLLKSARVLCKDNDINTRDSFSSTPLLYAVYGKERDATEFLLQMGADARAEDYHGQTALHIAAWLDLDAIATLLLDGDADIDAENDHGETPVHRSVLESSDAVLQVLVDRGANIGPSGSRWAPLQHSVEFGSYHQLRILVDAGVDVNAKLEGTRFHKKPLHLAALGFFYGEDRIGRLERISLLLENGANPNAVDDQGWTALHYIAIWTSRSSMRSIPCITVLNCLLEWGADINIKDSMGWTPLQRVAFHGGSILLAKFLLLNGATVSERDRENRTLLHLSAWNTQDEEIMQWLLDIGAYIDDRDVNDETPLHYSVRNNFSGLELTRILLDKSADLEARSSDGRTPLLSACATSLTDPETSEMRRKIVELILNKGADCRVTDNRGSTALWLACHNTHLREIGTSNESTFDPWALVSLLIDKQGLTRRSMGTHIPITSDLFECGCLDAAQYFSERAGPVQATSVDIWRLQAWLSIEIGSVWRRHLFGQWKQTVESRRENR